MRLPDSPIRTGFYFALPRLLTRIARGHSSRVEGHGVETYLPGIAILLITFLFFFDLLDTPFVGWKAFLLGSALLLGAFVFWLAALYLNSVVIRLARAGRIIRTLPDNRAQSVLICGLTTVFAWSLAQTDSAARFAGIAWLMAIALNLTAALLLAFVPPDRIRDE
ncbi:MAG: hypothetical protein ABI871_04705 [Chthoniobacterales bacterium]